MTMPTSDTGSSASSQQKSLVGLGVDNTDANNEFKRNFNQSLLGLKALNNQTDQEIGFSEFLSRMEKKDDDVVLLDEAPSFNSQTPKILQKNGSDIELLPKPNKFTINDSIRNSFKDIISNAKISRPQENVTGNENTLGNLLAKTKSIGVESRDKPTNNVKNIHPQNGITEKLFGNNLFENLQDIHSSTETREKHTDTQDTTGKASIQNIHDVIELDDSAEEDLLKSNGHSEVESKSLADDYIELDKKEEDKLLQIDSDLVESSNDRIVADDLKIENKLLELDNENSNHSVTSVKSDRSVQSVKSVASGKSAKSHESVHSVKSQASGKSAKSDHSTCSKTSIHSTKSSAHQSVKSDIIEDHNNLSNHSVKSDISDNCAAKSFTSIQNENSGTIITHNTTLQIQKDCSNDSHKSDIDNKFSESDCNKNEKLENKVGSDLESIKSNEKSPLSGENKDPKQSILKTLEDSSETSEDAKSSAISSCDNKCEKMEVDSKEEKKEMLLPEKCTIDIKNNDNCSIKSDVCDSDPQTNKSLISDTIKEDVENESIKITDSGRKRAADTDDSLSSLPKRSRLDDVIGKLGSQIGIPLDKVRTMEELSDTDATDASHLDSEMTESKSEETSSDTDVDEDEDEDVVKMKSPVKSPKKARRVSQKELSMIVKAKVMLYIRSYRDETLKDLHRKIDDLQRNNDHWKNKAKDLERRMLELTVLQQKHEKRKAKTAALRQISSKSIGVQVDENKVEKPIITSPTHAMRKEIAQQQIQSTPTKNGNKTPPRSSAPVTIQSPPVVTTVSHLVPINSLTPPRSNFNIITTQSQIQQALSLPVQRAPSHILVSPPSAAKPQQQPDPATGQYPCSKTVKSLLDSSRQQKVVPGTATMVPVFPASGIPKSGQLPQQQFIMVTSAPSIATTTKTNIPTTTVTNAKPQSKIIDLTDEEENAAKQVVPQVTKMAPIPTVVSGIPPQGLIRNITPQQGALPQQSILLSGPGGTRFVSPGQQQYQLVFNSGTPNIRPGSLVTVVTAPGAPGLRPAVSQTPVLPPPQLRAAQLVPLTSLPKTNVAVTSVATGMPQVRTVRPPPPLQSAPTSQNNQTRPQLPPTTQISQSQATPKSIHPAPLPVQDLPVIKPGEKPLAPRPTLKISRVSQGHCVQTIQLTDQSKMSGFNKEVPRFKLEWSLTPLHENLVLDSEHSIASLPMSSSQTDVLLPVTTQSLFDTQTDNTMIPSCPPSDENEVPPEFDKSLIDMSEHDIQQNKNTMKKTQCDVGLVVKFFRLKREERDIHLIPPNELDPLLARFLLTVKKNDGGDFEPSTLRSIISSVDRELRRTNYGHSIVGIGMKDKSFILTREALKAKQKQLKQQGKGNKPKRACPLTDEEIDILYNRNVLGSNTALSLINTLWLNNSVHFGLRGVHEHHTLRWGDITLNTASDGARYLQLNERQTKTKTGENLSDVREVIHKIYETEGERDPIKIFEIYSEKRPTNFSNAGDPFYLAPRPIPLEDPKTNIWFLRLKVGERKLSSLMRKMKESGKLDINKRFTNHSARKYLLQKLRENNV